MAKRIPKRKKSKSEIAQNAKLFRKKKAADISEIQEMLLSAGIVRDTGPFSKLLSDCQQEHKNTKDEHFWNYELINLSFSEITDKTILNNIQPQKASGFFVQLSLGIGGRCIEDEDEICDVLSDLRFEFEIIGTDRNSTSYYSNYHLDRHKGTTNFTPVHPQYHFQFGGRRLYDRIRSKKYDIGNALLIEPPRIAHPPLGVITGIDFVMSNFYPAERLKLLKNSRYKKILQRYQRIIWRSYVNVLASTWKDLIVNSNWKSNELWPQLIY